MTTIIAFDDDNNDDNNIHDNNGISQISVMTSKHDTRVSIIQSSIE